MGSGWNWITDTEYLLHRSYMEYPIQHHSGLGDTKPWYTLCSAAAWLVLILERFQFGLTPKTKNFSKFPVTSNLAAYA